MQCFGLLLYYIVFPQMAWQQLLQKLAKEHELERLREEVLRYRVSKEGMALASEKAKELGTAENALKANAMMNNLQDKMGGDDAKKEE